MNGFINSTKSCIFVSRSLKCTSSFYKGPTGFDSIKEGIVSMQRLEF